MLCTRPAAPRPPSSYSTHVSIFALFQSQRTFNVRVLHSDRLPNWTSLDRSSTSNSWRRCLGFEFLRLSKFMCGSACCIRLYSSTYTYFLVIFSSCIELDLLWHVCSRRFTQTKGGEEDERREKEKKTTRRISTKEQTNPIAAHSNYSWCLL